MNQRNRLDNLQVLRGIAAVLVVFHHVLLTIDRYYGYRPEFSATGSISNIGEAGVDIFFCISGFIITVISWDKFNTQGYPLAFIKNRLLRIVPLYWIFTFAVIGAAFIAPASVSSDINTKTILSSLFFMPINPNPILKVGWSLNYEIFFYLIFAALLPLSRRIAAIAGIVIVASIITLQQNTPTITSAITWFMDFICNPVIIEFCFGVLVGVMYKSLKISQSFYLLAFYLGGSLLCISALIEDAQEHRVLTWGIPATLLVLGSLRKSKNSAPEPLTKLGDASYSIYLSHPIFMPLLGKLMVVSGATSFVSPEIYITIAIITLTLVGVVVHFFVEQPITLFTTRFKQ
jgi:exopolysaccharide production protein ExoZ